MLLGRGSVRRNVQMDWSALLSALVGASAALLGVALTQRGERAKARADRVWAARVTCYKDMLDYSNELRRHGFYRVLADRTGDAVPEPPKAITGIDAILFASEPVLNCFNKAQEVAVALYGQHLAMTKFESPDPDETKKARAEGRVRALALAVEASKLGVELEQVIRKDIEPTDRLIVPKVFFTRLRKKAGSVQATTE